MAVTKTARTLLLPRVATAVTTNLPRIPIARYEDLYNVPAVLVCAAACS
jgi:hypothetical protein